MMDTIESVLVAAAQTLYLFAPLLVSAAISGVVMRLDLVPILKRPIDAGGTLRGRRLFGDGKTWRGFVTAVVGAILAVMIQKEVRAFVPGFLQVADYAQVSALSFGGGMGAGAVLGELPNSFVKRRLGIPAGGTTRGWRSILFYGWDQVDLLLGAWPILLLWLRPTLLLVVVSVGVALAVHPLVALIGYLVGARKHAR